MAQDDDRAPEISRQLFDDLMELIDAKIAEARSGDSSDGGLVEMIRARELETEFRHKHVKD